MSTFLWLLGFGLMMFSFSFLLGREERQQPRITVDTGLPATRRPKSEGKRARADCDSER